MAENIANPKVILKKKQIPVLIDFCLDESIEFSVRQQTFPEVDWEVELKLKDFKTAVLVGMFLRENKFEVEGIEPQRYKKQQSVTSNSNKKSEDKSESSKTELNSTKEKESEKSKTETSDTGLPTLL